MTALDRLRDEARRRGETIAQAVRHHVLEAIIARVARSEHGASFVLRGGMLTRAWIAPATRATNDLDYVGDFEFSIDETAARLAPALALELADGVAIDPAKVSVRGIWLDGEFPGVHVGLEVLFGGAPAAVGLDIGFRDPLVPAATTIELAGTPVRAVRPETQLAWKLHCLAEMGMSWRPKDVADLWLITSRVALEPAALPPAIVAAFESRGFTLDQARGALHAPHWATKTSRLRWGQYRARFPELAQVIEDLRARLDPVMKELP